MLQPNVTKVAREHRSTQNKTPARYILTPTPPLKKQSQVASETFHQYSAKCIKLNNNRPNKKVSFRPDIPSSSSTMMVEIGSQIREVQNLTQERFNVYRHRGSNPNTKSKKQCYTSSTKKTSDLKTFDDHEDDDNNDDHAIRESESDENEYKIVEDNDLEEQGKEFDQHVTEEDDEVDNEDEDENEDENEEDDDDDGLGSYNAAQKQQHNQYRHQHNDDELIADNIYSTGISSKKKTHQRKNFQTQLNELRDEFTGAISQLTDCVKGNHKRLEKRLTMFSKNLQQTTISSNLEKYRREGENFPHVVKYKGQNLLDIYDAGDCGRFARQVMKILFTPAEMSESILYANPTYARGGLDPVRMRKFKDAVRARFRISELHWNHFFNLCLRRTLTQMICDVRRNYKRNTQNQTRNEQQQQSQNQQKYQQSNAASHGRTTTAERHSQQEADDSSMETFDS